MLGYLAEKAKVCGTCGTHADEWERDPNAFVADMWTCPGCHRLDVARKAMSGDDNPGLHIFLMPTAIAKAMQEQREQADS